MIPETSVKPANQDTLLTPPTNAFLLLALLPIVVFATELVPVLAALEDTPFPVVLPPVTLLVQILTAILA